MFNNRKSDMAYLYEPYNYNDNLIGQYVEFEESESADAGRYLIFKQTDRGVEVPSSYFKYGQSRYTYEELLRNGKKENGEPFGRRMERKYAGSGEDEIVKTDENLNILNKVKEVVQEFVWFNNSWPDSYCSMNGQRDCITCPG